MPCGGGKTIMGCEFAERNGCRDKTMIVVPRIDLARQWGRVLQDELGEPVGYQVGSTDPEPEARIQVATVQAVMMRGIQVTPERLILDELHHYEANTWRMLLTSPELRGLPTLGLTATPQRADGKGLDRDFDNIVIGVQYSELIEKGHLVSGRMYIPRGGKPGGLAMDPVEAYAQLGEGDRCIASFGRVDEAEEWAMKFSSAGFPSAAIHANTPIVERKAILAALSAGELKVVTNVYLLTEGLDIPDVRVVILARRFQFVGTYVQVVGRALRAAPGKSDAIFLDLAYASQYHGAPDADRFWDTAHDPIGSSTSSSTQRGNSEEEERIDEYSMPVTGEGLVRVRHGSLKPNDPDPTPLKVPRPEKRAAIERVLRQIESQCRKMRARGKSANWVTKWRIREYEKITGRRAA
jgi:DNA repair protein RadD